MQCRCAVVAACVLLVSPGRSPAQVHILAGAGFAVAEQIGPVLRAGLRQDLAAGRLAVGIVYSHYVLSELPQAHPNGVWPFRDLTLHEVALELTLFPCGPAGLTPAVSVAQADGQRCPALALGGEKVLLRRHSALLMLRFGVHRFFHARPDRAYRNRWLVAAGLDFGVRL